MLGTIKAAYDSRIGTNSAVLKYVLSYSTVSSVRARISKLAVTRVYEHTSCISPEILRRIPYEGSRLKADTTALKAETAVHTPEDGVKTRSIRNAGKHNASLQYSKREFFDNA